MAFWMADSGTVLKLPLDEVIVSSASTRMTATINHVIGPRTVRLRFIDSGRRVGPSLLVVARVRHLTVHRGLPGDDRFETLRPGPGDGLLSVDLGTQRADVGKLPVALGVVEPVAHDEDARDVEPLVPDRDLNLRRLGLAQQREHLERGRLA